MVNDTHTRRRRLEMFMCRAPLVFLIPGKVKGVWEQDIPIAEPGAGSASFWIGTCPVKHFGKAPTLNGVSRHLSLGK